MNDGHVSWSPDYKSAPARTGGAAFVAARGSGAADPLLSEMRSLLTCGHHLTPEARKLIEMAIACQEGKPLDVTPLLPNDKLTDGGPKTL